MGIAVASPSSTPSASALGKVACKKTTGAAAVDPIVHHNQVHAMTHVHQFFGNNSWLPKRNSANYRDLLKGHTNCENKADTAGYWVPQLRTLSGRPIRVQSFRAYYRPFSGADFGRGEIIPANTRLVASQHDWSCGQSAHVGPQPFIPSCARQSGKPGHTLTAHVTFPSCWDGKLPHHAASEVGDTTDNAHWRYTAWSNKQHRLACPAGFGHKMIELRETIQYLYTGHGKNLKLTSDAMAGVSDGRSMHADFWNAWQMRGLASMVRNCIHRAGTFTHARCG